MKLIKCPACNSLKAKRIRKMWRLKNGKIQEGMQYRCADCHKYYVVYP